MQDAVSVRDIEGLCRGVSHGSISLVKQPNIALFVLDPVFMEPLVHAVCRPSIVLGNGRCAHQLPTLQDQIEVRSLWPELRKLLLLSGIYLSGLSRMASVA